ncbi:putative exported protein (plasmid) [Aliivibrio salmonicida LFI1238]|uniref:Exported protein n=1 Tax=Aliivibrio salmonicida (strain LFI1238) TaxID=316275 RepID=B6ESZ0_ALISL|nr:hypothetical protein [Aliivibrio salmonicida]CAQ81878.1 putative exported protein [Aliivibrio salmonicida LFI1238]
MRYSYLLLTSLFFINTAHATEQTLSKTWKSGSELRKERVAKMRAEDQADVRKMYFFVKHINDVGTPEKAKLDAFLLGLQEAFSVNQFMEKKTLGLTWFCARPSLLNGLNGENPVPEIIQWVYDTYPERFKSNGIYSPSSDALAYGLQLQYRCEGVPLGRIPGYKY